jgi:trehalose 6-phosphate synthase/phosphatase
MIDSDHENLNGKVLKLHFACHAELPYGSNLRITASNSLLASSMTTSLQSVENNADENCKKIYASSVEMVTTPEEYPVWRTRTPVICVVNNTTSDGLFEHRYRYIVTTPGAVSQDNDENEMMTGNDDDGYVDVTVWEDPFRNDANMDDAKMEQTSFAELPYRSIKIDVTSNTEPVINSVSVSGDGNLSESSNGKPRIDYFNSSQDASFQSFKDHLADLSAAETMMEDEDKKDTEELTENKRLFIVCYHLPVKITKDDSTGEFKAEFTESLIAKTKKSSVTQSLETFWVGTVSASAETEEEKENIRQLLEPLNCLPLFFDKKTIDAFYYGMCKQVLWPTFHNIDLLDIAKSGWGKNNLLDDEGHDAHQISEVDSNWDQSRLDVWWNAFCAVNKSFSTAIMNFVRKSDIVWVHDYHLSLLPKYLHEQEESLHGGRTLQMVFFLHIPFPTSQAFRELERGENILEGMLHADVVGFHAFDHARHFLNAAKRIFGLSRESLKGGLIGVRYRGTKVLVTINNVSIESDVVEEALNSQEVQNDAQRLQLEYKGRSIISGIDIAQGLSGVSLKLLAFERLLADYPVWRDKVKMVQICLVPNARKSDETDTLAHAHYLVKRIQNTFGSDVLYYEEIQGSSLPRNRRLALWLASDVFMSTPIREGLNLLPLEFVYTRKRPLTPGVTITSEFSAVCSILNGALRINPYDIQMASTSIDTALTMSEEEKISRRERDIPFLTGSCSGQWTRQVLGDLNDVTMASRDTEKIGSPKVDSISVATSQHSLAALLDIQAVTDAYSAAKKRVIFVDFNGTLVMKEPTGKYLKRDMLGTSGNKPPLETIKALTKMCADERTTVYVVSGDTEINIENAIGGICGLGLASGNGGSISHPIKDNTSHRKWETSDLGVDWNRVKEIAMPVLSKYTARANGSFVKNTSSSIGWSHYSCDPEWASILAGSLLEELEIRLRDLDVRIDTLKGVIEIVPRKLNKGFVVKEVLSRGEMPDFVLCVGDDISDEKMFKSVFSVAAKNCAENPNEDTCVPNHAFTCTVGKKDSNASFYVEHAEDVADLLIRMSGEKLTGRAKSWDSSDIGQAMFES